MISGLIIFDLDGTLLNTLDDLTDSLNHVLAAHGLPQHSKQAVKGFVGNGVRKLIQRAVPEGEKNPLFETVLEENKAYYREHMNVKTAPYPGIRKALKRLKEAGYILAIASNKYDTATQGLREQFFADTIDVAIGDGVVATKKPAPEIIEEVMRRCGITDRKQVLYVGDSDVDIQTAENAGIACISVSWGFRTARFLKAHGARVIIDRAGKLPEAVSLCFSQKK
ncbi:MAG: HAD-IIIA family hydrolase [Lachnospiraceae bacterium]|nr:HAD-IIIA family hydrolase [Lachnospiraceae bacterium]